MARPFLKWAGGKSQLLPEAEVEKVHDRRATPSQLKPATPQDTPRPSRFRVIVVSS